MNYRNFVVLPILMMSLCSISCDTNDDSKNSDFQTLCELSSGKVVGSDEAMRCQCSDETCDAGLVCNTLTNKCPSSIADSCSGDAQFCSSGKIYQCVDSNWVYQERCADNLGCASDNSKCLECNVGDQKCTANKLYKCNENGEYVEDQVCSLGCDESGNACATKCNENETLCIDGNLKTCTGVDFGEAVPCENGASCSADGKTCGECTNGTTKCVDNAEGVGQMSTCTDGKWVTTPCGDEENRLSCNAETNTCGECLNGSRCENDSYSTGTLYQCENGKLNEPVQCKRDMKDDKAGTSRIGMFVSCDSKGIACGECNSKVGTICEYTSGQSILYRCEDGALKSPSLENCVKGCHADFTRCRE